MAEHAVKEKTTDLPKMLLNVAWLAIALGLTMELIVLAISAGFGKFQLSQVIVSDSVQKVSWSFFVCTGVALGTAASRMRAGFMGLAGLIAAPIAFNIAKVLHKSTNQALAIPIAAAVGPSPLLLAGLKGLEYAVLGGLIGWLGYKYALKGHALIGLLVGVVFGSLILWVTIVQTPAVIPLAGMVARGANEVVFPVGCSMVLYAATQIGMRQRAG